MKTADEKGHALFWLMGELSQDSDRARVITRFMEAFRELWPEAHGHFTAEPCAASPGCFPVASGDTHFGCLLLDELHTLTEEDLALIRNALSLLGALLKTHEQDTLLKQGKNHRLKSFFEEVTENVQDGIWVADKADVILYVNRGMEAIAGVPREQIIGKNVLTDFPKATTQQFNVFYRQAKHDLTSTWYEVTVRTPGGENTWQNGWLVPVLKAGHFDGMICTIRDVTERKDAERELARSEARYRQLVETASDAIYLMDERGIIIDTNRIASQMLQRSREELIGSHIETVDPNFPVGGFPAFWNTVPYEEQKIFETTHLTKNGGSIPIEISGKKFQIDGKTYYFGVARDISARKASENALKRQRDFFELVINSVPIRIFWKDLDCVYLGCNTAFVNDAGMESPEEIIGGTDDILVWKENAEIYRADDRRVMRTGQAKLRYEEDITNRAGDRVVWRTSKMPLRNAAGDIIGVLATSENVTEETLAAEKLHANEEKYRLLVENLSEGIWYIDDKANTTYVNQRMADMLGYAVDDMIGKPLFAFMDERGKESAQRKLNKRRQGIREQHDFEFIRKDGARVHTLFETTPVMDRQNHYIGALAGVLDITQRKQTEEALRGSEKKFRSFYENSPFGIVLCRIIRDEHGKAIDFVHLEGNPAVAGHTSLHVEDLIGKHASELVDSTVLADLTERYDHVVTTGNTLSYIEYFAVYEKTLQVTVFAIEDDQFIINFIDITERTQAEEALRKSELKFKALFEQAGGYCMILDPNTESGIPLIVDANQAASESHGYSREEFIGRPVADIDDEDGKKMVIARTRAIMTGKPFYVENTHLRKDGSTFPAEVHAKRIDIEGEAPLIFTIEYDISERKEAERKLQESEEKLRLTIDHSPLGVCTVDKHGRLMTTNQAYENMLGYSKKELKQLSFFEITHPDDRPENRTLFEKMFSPKSVGFTMEKRYVRKDGSVIDARVHAGAIHDAQGKTAFGMAFVEDITERKQAQEQILQSLREKETLLRELYHRTKNNMNVIQSMLMLQASFSRNAEVERIAKEVGDKIQAMALVHQKLYQSQNLSRIPLHEYLPELAELLRQSYSISSAGITLDLEVAPIFALIDTAIPCGLILNELMSNAFKHAFPNDRNGEIQIQLTEDEQGLITLQVSDNGVGIPPDFDFRAQESLGLQSIVMIAEHQLRGRVIFTADAGVTCRIQFTDTTYQARV